jgi:hypothetical protein
MTRSSIQWPQTPLILPLLIAAALHSTNVTAQEGCEDLSGTPPGLYTTTDEGRTFIIKDEKVVELGVGETGYASEDKLTCITAPPKFLDWPCSTDAANSRKFATYAFSDITADNKVKEVVSRYFEVPEVIEPIPNWLEGEFHTKLNLDDIIQFASPEFWYRPTSPEAMVDPKRPKTLLISLYVGINQVVVDNYAVDLLSKEYGGKDIPVVFVFNDSNVVPVSYFGSNVSLAEIFKAFNERRIKLADVPWWPLGDYHFSPTSEEFKTLVDLPSFEDIDPFRREALQAELETFGFTRKPVFVTMLDGGGKIYVDDPARVSVAVHMGLERLPTVINFVEQDDHLRRCGPGTPLGSSGISGSTTPIGGANPPPGGVTVTPTGPPAGGTQPPPASDS